MQQRFSTGVWLKFLTDVLFNGCNPQLMAILVHVRRTCQTSGIISFLGALFVCSAAAAVEPKRVMLLHSFGSDVKPWSDYARAFRAELGRQSRWRLDIYEQSLVTARSSDENPELTFAEYLRALFAKHPLDLIVSIGAPAAAFVQRHRQQLFPTTPMLLTVVDQRRVRYSVLTDSDAVVAVSINYLAAFENILRVLPDTKNVAVVVGNSPIEKYWKEEIGNDVKPLANRIALTWYNELSFEDILKHAAALPPRSAIFWELMVVDAAGLPHEEGAALASLHAVANAPIFSYTDAFFGRDIVGGPHVPVLEAGQKAAEVAVRILGGEKAGDIKTLPVGFGTPKFDWREMQRWGISESRLPPGSEIHFRSPTAWQQYRWQILTTAAVVLFQAAMIMGLLYEHRRRRHSEIAAHRLSGQLITAHEEERAHLARELHDDVTQRLALLAIDAGREEGKLPGLAGGSVMRRMREGLVRLSEDVHALSYRLHPSILEDLGLVEALKSECERFSLSCSTRLAVTLEEIPRELPSEAALCLFRIAQEALRNIARHSRADRAELCLEHVYDGLQLTIRDDGVGFDPMSHQARASLGHAGMRQRVSLLGGRLAIGSSPGHGVTIVAWVPLGQEERKPSARAAG
jgi:signal transduction histidine kinase